MIITFGMGLSIVTVITIHTIVSFLLILPILIAIHSHSAEGAMLDRTTDVGASQPDDMQAQEDPPEKGGDLCVQCHCIEFIAFFPTPAREPSHLGCCVEGLRRAFGARAPTPLESFMARCCGQPAGV